MLKQGSSIKFLRAKGSPLKSDTLAKTAAAITCGCRFSDGAPLLDTVEDDGKGGLNREHTWTFDGDQRVEFRPDFSAEKIDFNELIRRFDDLAWCAANPHHPIAYLRYFVDNRAGLVALLKNRKPMEKLVRGTPGNRSICLIPQDATPEDREKMIQEFNRS